MSVNTLERDVARLLQEGQDAARRGDKAMARALLTQLVGQDPRNEEAWMWLSGVVTDPNEQQICLENALVINPYNAHARQGLEFVITRTNTPPRVSLDHPDSAASQSDQQWGAAPSMPAPASDVTSALFDPSAHTSQEARPAARPVDAFSLDYEDASDDYDAQPFVPPGMEDMAPTHVHVQPPASTLMNVTADQIEDELPTWLQDLTPSAPTNSPAQPTGEYDHYNQPGFSAQQANGAGAPGSHDIYGAPAAPVPAQPFGPAGFGDMGDMGDFSGFGDNAHGPAGGAGVPMPGPAGPFSDLRMPDPNELPGGMDGFDKHSSAPAQHNQHQNQNQNQAQPWYLQGSNQGANGDGSAYLDSTMLKSGALNSAMLTSTMMEDPRRRAVAVMPCPNCSAQVSETSLACPHCRYSFFVNCPYCHELIDTSEAIPDKVEPCPYCGKEVNPRVLGLGNAPDLISQKNPGSRPGDAGPAPDPAFPNMKQTLDINTKRKGVSMGWVVDVMWLIAIIAMVWALTQLPAWMHLSGLY